VTNFVTNAAKLHIDLEVSKMPHESAKILEKPPNQMPEKIFKKPNGSPPEPLPLPRTQSK
jgi:hypothetical protein